MKKPKKLSVSSVSRYTAELFSLAELREFVTTFLFVGENSKNIDVYLKETLALQKLIRKRAIKILDEGLREGSFDSLEKLLYVIKGE